MPASMLVAKLEQARLVQSGKRLNVGIMKAEQLGKPLGWRPCSGPITTRTARGGSVRSGKTAIFDHGPDWNQLIRCTVTLNRPDDGEDQNSVEKALRQERRW